MEEVNWSSAVTASVGKNSVDSFSMRLGFHSHSKQKHTWHTGAVAWNSFASFVLIKDISEKCYWSASFASKNQA